MSNESGDQAINQSSDSDLTFMMGEFEAVFPTDRVYARNHMWAQEVECEKAAGKFRLASRLTRFDCCKMFTFSIGYSMRLQC